MPWENRRIESSGELFKVLSEFTDQDKWACRGMSRSYDGTLFCKLDRYKTHVQTHKDRLGLERHAMLRFLHAARPLVTPSEMPLLQSIIPRMMIMQHYGAPTRLLDWTKSPWIGLYFACNAEYECDGELWMFDRIQHSIMEGVAGYSQHLRQEHGAGPGAVPALWIMLFSHVPKKWLVLLDPLGSNNGWNIPHANPRIVSQQAMFSMCGELGADHAAAIERGMGASGQDKMYRIVIPASLKIPCLKRLASMNINAASLFPGIDGLGKHVSDSLHYSYAQDPMSATLIVTASNGSVSAIEMPPV
jgi:hypothetical protein